MDEFLELKILGQRLRDARVKRKMSQADLAFAADLSLPFISNYELGKKKMSVLIFSRIISALKVSADEILRPDVPTVNLIYQKELADLLSGCTAAQAETIIRIAKEVKSSFPPSDYD